MIRPKRMPLTKRFSSCVRATRRFPSARGTFESEQRALRGVAEDAEVREDRPLRVGERDAVGKRLGVERDPVHACLGNRHQPAPRLVGSRAADLGPVARNGDHDARHGLGAVRQHPEDRRARGEGRRRARGRRGSGRLGDGGCDHREQGKERAAADDQHACRSSRHATPPVADEAQRTRDSCARAGSALPSGRQYGKAGRDPGGARAPPGP